MIGEHVLDDSHFDSSLGRAQEPVGGVAEGELDVKGAYPVE